MTVDGEGRKVSNGVVWASGCKPKRTKNKFLASNAVVDQVTFSLEFGNALVNTGKFFLENEMRWMFV